jgi:hypothetical protein
MFIHRAVLAGILLLAIAAAASPRNPTRAIPYITDLQSRIYHYQG